MKATLKGRSGTWRDVADAARTTVGMDDGTGEPSSRWKTRMLLAEHSPIRILSFTAMWEGLKYWVSTHLVRHKYGIEHFVRSQRSDRTGLDREQLPQSVPVEHRVHMNAQAIIFISRKRLCRQASFETRDAWQEMLITLADKEPELFSICVPDCIYRGWCYEMNPCGFMNTRNYAARLQAYREETRQYEILKENQRC